MMGYKNFKKLQMFKKITDDKFDVGNPSLFDTQLEVADFLTVKSIRSPSETYK